MSDIDNGIDATPMVYGYPSGTTSGIPTVSHSWLLIADEHTVHFSISAKFSSGNNGNDYISFGDLHSFQEHDAFKYYVIGTDGAFGSGTTTTIFNHDTTNPNIPGILSNTTTTFSGINFAKDYNGIGGVAPYGLFPKFGVSFGSSLNAEGNGLRNPTIPTTNGIEEIIIQPALVARYGVIRGYIRGMALPVSQLTSLTGYENLQKRDVPFVPGTEIYTMFGGGQYSPSTSNGKAGIWIESGREW